MANKPTTEELDKGIQDAITEGEQDEVTTDNSQVNEKQVEQETTDDETQEDVKEEVDYKKKFIESTKEAQILASKNKKLTEAFQQADTVDSVTDDEVKKEYPEWDDLSDFEKKMARKSVLESRKFQNIHKLTEEFKNIDSWQTKVKEFTGNPKTLVDNPRLEGKTEEFEAFASKPSRIGVDFNDLISAFLFEESQSKVKHKGKMFETGGGGVKEKPKKTKITLAEAEALRNSNYSKYKELLMAGKIEDSID